MKKILSLLLCAVLLSGCGSNTITEVTAETAAPTVAPPAVNTPLPEYDAPEYTSRFDTVTEVLLSGSKGWVQRFFLRLSMLESTTAPTMMAPEMTTFT